MLFHQFYLEELGHASYLVGDETTGQALVFDPRRDVGVYFERARKEGLRIVHAMDSHGHNDYLSGIGELSMRGITPLGYAEADLRYDHRPVKDGEVIELGDVALELMHTPGHTPEHVSLLVYDRSVGPEPAMMLSGGALLVGDVARPDLLGGPEQVRAAAATFCRTLQERLLLLPDHLEIFPTHVAGSLCAASIGSRLSTTLGYERRTNELLSRISSTEEFIEECMRLDNLPAVPPYWRRMRAQNLAGVRPLGSLPEPVALTPEEFMRRQSNGALVLDTRQPEAFGGGHIPGALNVGRGPSLPTWAGTVLPEGAEILLVLDRPDDLWDVVWQLLRIGYDIPVGWLAGGMHAWRTAAQPIDTLPQITVRELHERLTRGEVQLLDVRQPSEWAGGHVEGATFITGAEVPARVGDVPEGKPLAVTCGSGYRSSVVASLLKRDGRKDVINVLGGMSAWQRAGLPLVFG